MATAMGLLAKIVSLFFQQTLPRIFIPTIQRRSGSNLCLDYSCPRRSTVGSWCSPKTLSFPCSSDHHGLFASWARHQRYVSLYCFRMRPSFQIRQLVLQQSVHPLIELYIYQKSPSYPVPDRAVRGLSFRTLIELAARGNGSDGDFSRVTALSPSSPSSCSSAEVDGVCQVCPILRWTGLRVFLWKSCVWCSTCSAG